MNGDRGDRGLSERDRLLSANGLMDQRAFCARRAKSRTRRIETVNMGSGIKRALFGLAAAFFLLSLLFLRFPGSALALEPPTLDRSLRAAISAGANHSLALEADGSLWAHVRYRPWHSRPPISGVRAGRGGT